jgi:aminopeptidase N
MPIRKPIGVFAALVASAFCAAQPRERTYDLQHVAFRLKFDEQARTFDAVVTNTVAPLADGTRSLWFDCQGLQVRSVAVDGDPATFRLEANKLHVDLGRAFGKGQKLDIQVRYGGKPTGGLYFVHERDAWPARSSMVYSKGEPEYNRQWLVTYDFPDDKATSECWISCKPGYTAVSNGVLAGVEKGEREWTYHWRMEQPHSTYLIAFAVADYEKSVETLGDLPVEYYVPRGLADQGRASFAGTARIVDYFGKLTGVPYPYKRFSQLVVGDFVTGGMEHTTMVTNNISTLHAPEEQPLDSSTGLVAHELAHQWFGDLVTCANWSHMWLNEGFASLLPAFWTRESEGQGEFELARKSTVAGGYGASRNDRAPAVLQDYGPDPDRMFRGVSYSGGGARLFMLIDLLGEDVFWKGVKDYLTTYRFKPATTDQFFAVMASSSGRDLELFKQQWFYRDGVPSVTVAVQGRSLRFTQTDPWTLDVPVWQFSDGRWSVQRVRVSGAQTDHQLAGDGPVLVDPERRVMAQFSGVPAFPSDFALAAYRAAESAAVRDELLGRFPQLGDEGAFALLGEEKVARLRSRIAGLVRGTDGLLKLVDDHDRRIANAAVQRLGAVQSSPAVLTKLREVMEKDSNPRIRCQALEALFRLTGDGALVESAWSTESPNEAFRLFALRHWAGTAPERARALCLDLVRSSTNTTLRLEAIRRLGALKDAPGSRTVYDALVSIVVDEASYQGRMAAASSLAQYGDKAALTVLRPLLNEGNTRFANNVRGSVGRLERAGN